MNPAAPVWVSATSTGGGTAPIKSALDPNSAAFRPKHAAGGSAVQAGPARSTASAGAVQLGSAMRTMTGVQVPTPAFHKYLGGPPPMPPQGFSGAGAGGRSPHVAANTPFRGMPSHHHPMGAMGPRGGGGAMPFGPFGGSGGLTGSPTSASGSTFHGAAQHQNFTPSSGGQNGLVSGQLYAAKANTHWGSAVPASQSNNTQRDRPEHSGSYQLPHGGQAALHPYGSGRHQGFHGGHTYSAHGFPSATPSLNPVPASSPAPVAKDRPGVALASEGIFAPTCSIWGGASADQAASADERALDTGLATLIDSSLEALKSLTDVRDDAPGPSPISAPSAVLDPALLLSLSGVAGGHDTTQQNDEASLWPHSTPLNKVEPAQDTVQHLLAQLTQKSPQHASTDELREPVSPDNSLVKSSQSTGAAVDHSSPSSKKENPMKPAPRSVQQAAALAAAASTISTPELPAEPVNTRPSPSSKHTPPPPPPPETLHLKGNHAAALPAAVPNAPSANPATAAANVTTVTSSRRFGSRKDVEALLANAKETMRHVKILSFSKQFPEEIAKLFQGWATKGIPSPDDTFGAYYLYVVKKSGVELCMKHNGRGRVPGVGYGGCDFANRGPNYRCRFHHVCLFCKGDDHGWFDEAKCTRYNAFRKELTTLGLRETDIPELLEAYDAAATP